ncbi:hypothetical protein [Fluviispira vulneris]|uniref:hypothetical protein n=1 Tax=Fluviispira vulneris TaxID=2763012 RepID=UPI001648F78E|nr:hypothetical protein [Fluviispira vulneris]
MRIVNILSVVLGLGMISQVYSANNDENMYGEERNFYITCANKNNINNFYYPKYGSNKYFLVKGVLRYESIKFNDNNEKYIIIIKNKDYKKLSKICMKDYFMQPVKPNIGSDFYFAVEKQNSFILIDGSKEIEYKNIEEMTHLEFNRYGESYMIWRKA